MKKKISMLLMTMLVASASFGQLKAKVTTKNSSTSPSVSLTCSASASGTPAQSFNFYRSTTSGGPYSLLGTSPMQSTCAYTDNSVSIGITYYYVATSLDIAVGGLCPSGTSCESGYSNQATAVIPAAPTVTAISPNSGTTLGGNSVTITGTGFLSGATVTFGSTAATNVVVVSSTSITATTPAVNASTVAITVTNTNSLSGTLAAAYTFITPAPNSPTGLTVGTITANNIPLQWTPPVPQAGLTLASFNIYRGIHAGMTAPAKIANVPASVTNYTDTTCSITICYYEIEAVYTVPVDYSNIVRAVNP